MDNSIQANQNSNSPFNSIRKIDENGREYWSARDLMPILGYSKWESFGAKEQKTINTSKTGNQKVSTICRAIISCNTSGNIAGDNFIHFRSSGNSTQLGLEKTPEDWHLSRFACYLIAMCGDVTKPEIAAAQAYFAAKTHEAEVATSKQVESLEKQFRPEPSTQSRLDAIKILKASGHKKEYIQRLGLHLAKATCPDIPTPEPQEMNSLPTTKALLTPTQLAKELKLFCKSNPSTPDARRVNSLLAELGYQESIGSRWSATQKAIDLNLVDRKPVDTNSRTQKDQLLWSADILPILSEHLPVKA